LARKRCGLFLAQTRVGKPHISTLAGAASKHRIEIRLRLRGGYLHRRRAGSRASHVKKEPTCSTDCFVAMRGHRVRWSLVIVHNLAQDDTERRTSPGYNYRRQKVRRIRGLLPMPAI
jgi:hypothetical protein